MEPILLTLIQSDTTITLEQRELGMAALKGQSIPMPAKPESDQSLLLTQAEACRLLKISPTTLWRLTKCKKITPVELLGARRYKRADVEALAAGVK